MSKSVAKALRAGIDHGRKCGISTFFLVHLGSTRAFATDLDNPRRCGPREGRREPDDDHGGIPIGRAGPRERPPGARPRGSRHPAYPGAPLCARGRLVLAGRGVWPRAPPGIGSVFRSREGGSDRCSRERGGHLGEKGADRIRRGAVPAPHSIPLADRPAWWGSVSHVVTRSLCLDHLRAVGPLMFRWTTVFREPGRLFSGLMVALSCSDHLRAVGTARSSAKCASRRPGRSGAGRRGPRDRRVTAEHVT